jgi:hypothetical protein
MSVVETKRFEMPLGDPGEAFKPFGKKSTAIKKGAFAGIKRANNTKEKLTAVSTTRAPNRPKKVKQQKVEKDFSENNLNLNQFPVVEIGATIPIHPGKQPSPTRRVNNKIASNPAYDAWKERARKFNAGVEEQAIAMGQHGDIPLGKVKVPGKAQRARGFELPKGNGRTALKSRQGMIRRMHREALRINNMRNRNINRRQNFPS